MHRISLIRCRGVLPILLTAFWLLPFNAEADELRRIPRRQTYAGLVYTGSFSFTNTWYRPGIKLAHREGKHRFSLEYARDVFDYMHSGFRYEAALGYDYRLRAGYQGDLFLSTSLRFVDALIPYHRYTHSSASSPFLYKTRAITPLAGFTYSRKVFVFSFELSAGLGPQLAFDQKPHPFVEHPPGKEITVTAAGYLQVGVYYVFRLF